MLVKSVHTLIFLFFLCTAIIFEIHLGYLASSVNPTSSNLLNSIFTWAHLSGFIRLSFCLTSFALGLTSSMWQVTPGSTPSICSCRHAKIWFYFHRRAFRSSCSLLISYEMNVISSGNRPIMTIFFRFIVKLGLACVSCTTGSLLSLSDF